MKQIDYVRHIALSFPDTTELPHFEKTSFRVKKKIFVTYDEKNNRACVKLSESDQALFSLIDKSVIHPVPNKWGKQGWTFIELDKLDNEIIEEVVKSAYTTVLPKKILNQKRDK
jgi:predicted DNA-binding protein (MmcQ/YjbR family)